MSSIIYVNYSFIGIFHFFSSGRLWWSWRGLSLNHSLEATTAATTDRLGLFEMRYELFNHSLEATTTTTTPQQSSSSQPNLWINVTQWATIVLAVWFLNGHI